MDNLTKFYIDGAWTDPISTATMPVLNPATQEQIGTVTLGSEDDLNLAVAAANAAFKRFSMTSKADRMDLLNSLMDVSRRRFEDLAQAMSAEMGAPISFARDAGAWRQVAEPCLRRCGYRRHRSCLCRRMHGKYRPVL